MHSVEFLDVNQKLLPKGRKWMEKEGVILALVAVSSPRTCHTNPIEVPMISKSPVPAASAQPPWC